MSEANFDLRTSIRDPKTGVEKIAQPYRLRVSAEGARFERPPGSGKFYDAAGTLIRDEKAEQAKIEAAKKAAAEQTGQVEVKAPQVTTHGAGQAKIPEPSLAEAEKAAMESVNSAAKAKAPR